MDYHQPIFNKLLASAGKHIPEKIIPLPQSGSSRIYYRFLFKDRTSLIGSYNSKVKENIAHYAFTRHFTKKGLPVPAIIAFDETKKYMVLEDVGNHTLFDKLMKDGLKEDIRNFYLQSMEDLVKFQTEGIKGLDLSVAFPTPDFNARSIHWDLNYFKYYFIKTNPVIFDEKLLEDDFEKLARKLLNADSSYFMFRDFQARNIMVNKGKLTYIDFQGGRKGPLQYDVVSLLYQAKANLPQPFREELLEHYINSLESVVPNQKEYFLIQYPLFIYFRLMQVLGAYGYRGILQRKAHFLQSIPPAVENLRQLMNRFPIKEFSELHKVFGQIITLTDYDHKPLIKEKLNITLSSFSYKKTGPPVDVTENGGGFVFDCRALPNPGRIPELRDFTGLQEPVIHFLKQQKEMSHFLENVFRIVDQSVDNYLERNFNHLMVSFGCTGGKHRSTFSAENLHRHLTQKYGDKLNIRLKHIQLEKDNLI